MIGSTRRALEPCAVLLAAMAVLTGLCSCQKRPEEPATAGGQEAAARQITTPTGMEMVPIPAGSFTMGNDGEIDAKPIHQVSVSGFYMGKHEVTQEIYAKVMGKNPSKWKGETNPVERVSWLDAIRSCNALSEKEGLRPCYDLKTRACDFKADGYRLPTEAEWEYACRAGTTADYHFGRTDADLARHEWFQDNAFGQSHPVGKKRPNAFGLYDMSGNVREWCNDWYQVDGYKQDASGPVTDPRGPAKGQKKVLRGGAWSVTAKSCTSWTRYCDDPGFTDACLVQDDCGFRCVKRAGAARR